MENNNQMQSELSDEDLKYITEEQRNKWRNEGKSERWIAEQTNKQIKLIQKNIDYPVFYSDCNDYTIGLLVTTVCNYNCPFCPIKTNNNSEIDLNILDTFLKDAVNRGYKTIKLTGGECCLHSKFKELIDLIAIKHDMSFTLVTNCGLWERYKFLVENPKLKDKFNSMGVSLDGRKEIHDMFRGKGAYDKVMEALNYFSGKLPITIKTELNNQNYKEILQIVKITRKFKNVRNHFFYVETFKKFLLNNEQVKEINDTLEKNTHFLLGSNKFEIRLPTPCNFLQPCSSLQFKEIEIDSDGLVALCCDEYDQGHPRYADIKVHNVMEILRRKKDYVSRLTKEMLSFLFDCNGNYWAVNPCSLCKKLRNCERLR